MTTRKKAGLTAIITMALVGIGGIIKFAIDVDPSWWPTVITLVISVAGVFGFTIVYPVDPPE